MIKANLAPNTEIRARVINLFKSGIHRSAGDYNKTLTSLAGMFNGLEEIQAYNEESVRKRLDLVNAEIWSLVYLPATETTETQGNYEDKVIFKHV